MRTLPVLFFLMVGMLAGSAQPLDVVLEPDLYPNGANLHHVIPQVAIYTAGANNSSNFAVFATTSTLPYQPPTGSNVFSHVGIPFFNNDRRMRMDFDGVVSSISIDFQSGGSAEQGRFEGYDELGNLVASYLTSVLSAGAIETMTLTRSTADIAWATAYTNPGQGSFGRLDHLIFSEPVPEPSSLLLVALGVAGFWLCRQVKKA